MLFRSNEQTLTQFSDSSGLNNIPTNAQAVSILRQDLGTGPTNLAQSLSSISQAGSEIVDALKNTSAGQAITKGVNFFQSFSSGETGSSADNTTSFFSAGKEELSSYVSQLTSGQGLRTTKRTKDTIALYMPDTLVFNDNQHFNELQMGDNLGTGMLSGLAGAIEGYRANGGAGVAKNVSPFVADAVSKFAGGLLGSGGSNYLFAASTGLVRNPMMEVLYNSPQLRTFQFDFMFYPRSESEAKEVWNIIETIRFHAAPEFKNNSGGYYLIPPSEFDIKFMYNGQENPNIPKIIGSCVLESIDLDYAPNGFAAYESVGENSPSKGGTGTPVATRMTLRFRETTIVTKQDFETARSRKSAADAAAAAAKPTVQEWYE